MSFRKNKLSVFMDKLGSSAGAPGGGAAAALTAAMGLALGEMVAQINAKKTGERSLAKAAKLKALRRSMEKAMDTDAATFDRLSKFYKSKDRGPRYHEALENCAEVPMGICAAAAEGIRIVRSEAAFTGRWLMSDLKESEILLKAAFYSAKLNVDVNLNEIPDKNYVAGKRNLLNTLAKKL